MGTELLHAAAQGQRSGTKSSRNPGDSVFGIVVSSPYMRCVQTAAQVCRAGKLPLLLDNALGEVYSPEIMGKDIEPDCVLRAPEEAARYCAALGVELRTRVIGQWPKWPETLGTARVRYVRRFLQYLRRSEVTRRNFILVTHAHGVAAMLSTMPAMQARSIKHVDMAGYFVARAVSSGDRPGCGGIGQAQDVGDDADATQDWARHWEVMCSKVKVGRSIEDSLMTRIKRWAGKSRYSEHQIHKLLHCSPNKTACGSFTLNHQDGNSIGWTSENSDSFSDTGASTVCFGMSPKSSPGKVYSNMGVSPPHSPSKSYIESGTDHTQTSQGRGVYSPAKLYCEVGVSPLHTPVKPYVADQLPKQELVPVEAKARATSTWSLRPRRVLENKNAKPWHDCSMPRYAEGTIAEI